VDDLLHRKIGWLLAFENSPGIGGDKPVAALKDFRRIATRYDKLARNFFSSACLVAAVVYWM
jgi:hypothetical protein